MKISDQIKEIVKHSGCTITELSLLMHTSQANLANKLVRDNFRLSEVKEMLNAMGYHDIEITARDNNETVIIKEDGIEFKPDTKYMVFDEETSLLEDIKENGFRDRKFKDIVYELLEPYMKPKFGDLWDTYVPKEFEEGFKDVINKQMSIDEFTSKLYKDASKKD